MVQVAEEITLIMKIVILNIGALMDEQELQEEKFLKQLLVIANSRL